MKSLLSLILLPEPGARYISDHNYKSTVVRIYEVDNELLISVIWDHANTQSHPLYSWLKKNRPL